MLACWMLAASCFYLFAPDLLINLFGSKNAGTTGINFEQVHQNVIIILRWAILFNLLDATRFIAMGSLRGAGDTRIPLAIGMATSWLIRIPGTFYLICVVKTGVSQVWALITFYMAVDAALMVWRRRSGAWKTIRVIDLPPAPTAEEEQAEEAAALT